MSLAATVAMTFPLLILALSLLGIRAFLDVLAMDDEVRVRIWHSVLIATVLVAAFVVARGSLQ